MAVNGSGDRRVGPYAGLAMSIESTFEGIMMSVFERAFEGRSEDEIRRVIESDGFRERMVESVREIGGKIADTCEEGTPRMIAERRGHQAIIAEEIRRAYGPGLDRCEGVLRAAEEMGEEHVDLHFRPEGIPATQWVLGHLHARACRIGEEALLLLQHGFGLGAFTRWRALHEVVVVGRFVSQHGDEVALRYAAHVDVNRWRLYKEAEDAGRLRERDRGDYTEAQARANELAAQYGETFLSDYGWATEALGGSEHGGFRGIEAAVDLSGMRVDYREASGGVHAMAAWVFEPPDAEHFGTTMVTGASPIAIAAPASAVAVALLTATETLLYSKDAWSAPFVVAAIALLCQRAAEALAEGEQLVERWHKQEDGGD
jgi:hypothetical protein